MREARNPFRLRTAELIDSEAAFLKLFSPGMLDLVPTEELWDKPRIFRSAPGGGKTSLLRLFTPSSLKTLHALKSQDDIRELWDRVSRIGALGEAGATVLGVYLVCNRSYAIVDDDSLDSNRRERLFFGLLNARIIIAALRAALELHGLEFPDELARISWESPDSSNWSFVSAKTGDELFKWAVAQEASICDAIDSFGDVPSRQVSADSTIAATGFLRPGVLRIDNEQVAHRCVLMLDDLQQLTRRQRTLLVQTIANAREGVAVWLAERFEALTVSEMFESGAVEGRDYDREILIERYWRRHAKKFESLVMNIGDRRAKLAIDADVTSLGASLEQRLEGKEWNARLSRILPKVEESAKRSAAGSPLYDEWLKLCEEEHGVAHENVIDWRCTEILIHRQQAKRQQALSFALSAEELEARSDAGTRNAAELFLAREFDLPYYFGNATLATLASCNVEQFLRIAAEEFEEILATAILRKVPILSASRQDAIAKAASKRLWDEIPRRAYRGEDVRRLLTSTATFAAEQTFKPNAPYSPGVTGIAISMRDRETLMDNVRLATQPQYQRVADVLASAIAQNFLEPILDYRVKGDTWMVLYLNRALCPAYHLPLYYGGFRERKLSDLYQWSVEGYRPSRRLVAK